MAEIWCDVSGYVGLYQVSNFGRVKSAKKIMKLQDNGCGYLMAHLSKNGKAKWHLAHRLVAKAFIPNPEKKQTVNHKDGNRLNNKASNLEWATYSENNLHSYRSNKRKNPRAKSIYCAETGEVYVSSYDASRNTGISQACINRCVNGIFKTAGGKHWKLLNRKEKIYV